MNNTKSLSLRKNFLWSLSGNVIYNACQWGVLSILNKFGGTESAGLFVLGLAIAIPVTQFCSLQLRAVYVSDVKDNFHFYDYLGTRNIWNTIAFIVIVIISFFYWSNKEALIVIIFMGLATNIQTTGDIFSAFFQKHGRQDIWAISLIIKGLLSVVAVSIVFFWTHSVSLVVLMIGLARLMGVLFYDRFCAARLFNQMAIKNSNDKYGWNCIKPGFSLNTIRKISITGLPLGLTMLMITLCPQIPRFFLAKYTDISTLGIFGSIAYIMVAGNMMLTALGSTVSPRLAKSYENNNIKDFIQIIRLSIFLFLMIGILSLTAMFLGGRYILVILYNSDFAAYQNVLMILTLSCVLSFFTSIAGYGLTAARYFKVQPFISFGYCAITLLTSWWSIPRYGIIGACWAVLISTFLNMCVFLVLLYIVCKGKKYAKINQSPSCFDGA